MRTWPSRIAALLRILVGCVFVVAGAMKLTDSELLYGGVMRRLEESGAAFPFYENLLLRYLEPNQERVIFIVAVGEILIGLSFLAGAFVSWGAVAGTVLLINYVLATAHGDMLRLMLYSYGAVTMLMLARGVTGLTWGADKWLVERCPPWLVLFPLRLKVPGQEQPSAAS